MYLRKEEPTCTQRGNARDPKREGAKAGWKGGGAVRGRRGGKDRESS